MRLAVLLRLTAIGIAALALLDPPLVVAPQPALLVSVAVADSRFSAMPAGSGSETQADVAQQVVERLREALGTATDVRVASFSDGERIPCGLPEPCVVVTDGARDVAVPGDRRGPTSVVSVGRVLTPNLRIAAVRAFPTHVAAEGLLAITLAGEGLAGRSTDITLTDGGAIVARLTHAFTSDAAVTVDARWWPVASGPRVLNIDAAAFDGERSVVDNGVDMAVDVQEQRMPVLVYEPRPSFASAFVRRALETDVRFVVDARTRLGASLIAGTTTARLDAAALDRYQVVIVGAPEALTADEVTRLDTFVRKRGGTLLLVPDRRMRGPVERLVALEWVERLQPAPIDVGTLRASELLTAKTTGFGDEVLATTSLGPAIVATPTGVGRIIVSGALDAWRYRLSGTDYDRFWRGIVADAAAVAGHAVSLDLSPTLVEPGGEVTITVRARLLEPPAQLSAAVSWQCGAGEARPLRLWPAAAAGTFVATVRADALAGACTATASITGVGEARARAVVMNDVRTALGGAQPQLERTVPASGGVWAKPDDLQPLVAHLQALRSTNRQPEERRPMRSAWWLVPLSLCLAGEWWLRRRGGVK